MLFKFKSPYHLARFILFSRSNLEVGILIQNKMNICKSIFMLNTGPLFTVLLHVHGPMYCGCSTVAEFLTYNDSFGDIPEQAFFSGLGLVPVFSFFLLFPLPALFNPNPLHQRAFRCDRCSTWAVANNSVGFFFIETELTNINWK